MAEQASRQESRLSFSEATLRSDDFLSLSREDQLKVIERNPPLKEAAERLGFRPGLRGEQAGPPTPPARQGIGQRLRPSEAQVRQGVVALGGGIGGAFGAAGGLPAALPTVGGSVAGGALAGEALGSAAASLASDVIGLDRSPSALAGVNRALNEGALGAAFQGVGNVAPGMIQATGRKLLGITPESIKDFARGAEVGVNLAVENVTQSRFVRGFRNVLGRFPLVASPLQKGSVRVGAEGAEAFTKTLDSMAPIAHFAELGADLNRASRANIGGLRAQINENYANFRRVAVENDATVPLSSSLEKAKEMIDEIAFSGRDAPRVVKEAKKVLGLGVKETEASPILNALGESPAPTRTREPIDVVQHRAAVQNLDEAIGELREQGKSQSAGQLAQLRKTLEADLNDIVGPPEVREALGIANNAFSRFAKFFKETPTARRLARANPRLFEDFPQQPVPQTEIDKLFEEAFTSQTNSVRAIGDLRRIVGDESVMRKAGRAFVDQVGSRAIRNVEETGEVFLNLKKLKGDLGLFLPKSRERAALVLTLGKENVKNIENVVKVLEQVSETEIVNISQFVARRGLLGGLKGAIRSFVPLAGSAGGGAAAGAGVGGFLGVGAGMASLVGAGASVAAFLISTRRFGRMITNPEFMRSLAQTIGPNVSKQQRIAASLRLSRLAPQLIGDPEDVSGTLGGPGSAGRGLASRLLEIPLNLAGPGFAAGGRFAAKSLPRGLGGELARRGTQALPQLGGRLAGASSAARGSGAAARAGGLSVAGITLGELMTDLEQSAVAAREALRSKPKRTTLRTSRERSAR